MVALWSHIVLVSAYHGRLLLLLLLEENVVLKYHKLLCDAGFLFLIASQDIYCQVFKKL
jgi:hypothetical protein